MQLSLKICWIVFLLHQAHLMVLNATECGDSFDNEKGTFNSPSYSQPDAPRNNESCEWRISSAADEKIELTLTDVDIEKNAQCSLNYVEVRDGLWPESPVLGKFCGVDSFDPVRSSGNEMYISYVYNNRENHRGFLASYESICGKDIFVEDEANLTSPNYPNVYPNNKRCIYRIVVHEDRKVAISFKVFDLESTENCTNDYVVVRDEWSVDSNILGIFCNETQPFQILSPTNRLSVEFVSDDSERKSGFSAVIQGEYDECLEANDCAQICINTIGSYKCDCNPGYQLAPNGKDCEVTCGGIFNTTSGTIEPPTLLVYPLNGTCTWDIETLPENQIKILFLHFDIDGSYLQQLTAPRCSKDKLEVYTRNRINKSFELQGVYCGSAIPSPVFSYSDAVRIVFSSYYSNKNTPFSLKYFTSFGGCSINNGNCQHGCDNTTGTTQCICNSGFTADGHNCVNKYEFEIGTVSGKIKTANYPGNCPPYEHYWWKFMTTPGNRIKLNFLDFHTYPSSDKVIIHDGPSNKYPVLGSFSGYNVPKATISTGSNQMFIQFYSTGWERGFLANYSTVCGGHLSAESEEKYIYSHGYFGYADYENNTDCTWNITASSGNLVLKFLHFHLENSDNCAYDSIEIFSADENFGKFCGDKPLPDIISPEPLQIRFQSVDTGTNSGFIATYRSANTLDIP